MEHPELLLLLMVLMIITYDDVPCYPFAIQMEIWHVHIYECGLHVK
jgi:hypothetical protein